MTAVDESSQPVIVIGGGLAGLAAAVALGQAGWPVTLLESRGRWGGRASSFVDQTTGETIDNCQHVSMGCCTNYQAFCQTVGIDEFFHREPRLWFLDAAGHLSALTSAPLPAPLHLLPSLLTMKLLSWSEKFALARGMLALVKEPLPDDNRSFSDWLQQHRQPAATIERFWSVVLVSALSETLDRIDVGQARKVFLDGFLANRNGWEVFLPSVPLEDLYGRQLADWLRDHGVTTRLQAGVRRLIVADDRVREVELRNGETLAAEQVVLAVPHYQVAALLPPACGELPYFSNLSQLETAPISSAHLWYDRPIMPLRHVTLVGRLSQWVFNRSLIQGTASDRGYYYQVVISAARHVAGLPQEVALQQVVQELADIWPAARQATLRHGRLVTEHRAVLSMTPGVDRLRPGQQSPIANLQLAGDWTQTGWPSTMEGAVRSGYLAAENVLQSRGRRARILAPDLPATPLARLVLGL
jgi:squalene-associated FAD-dependent desaturase